jgi:hypothetical protein
MTSLSLILISVLVGVTSTNLYAIDKAFAVVKSACEALPLVDCSLASERSSVASAGTIGEKENSIVEDESASSTKSTSTMIGNDNEDNHGVNTNTNIQSQIPSMINSIPFP